MTDDGARSSVDGKCLGSVATSVFIGRHSGWMKSLARIMKKWATWQEFVSLSSLKEEERSTGCGKSQEGFFQNSKVGNE